MRLQTRIVLWSLGGILLATTVTLALTLAMQAWKSKGSLERSLYEVADIVAGLPEVRAGLTKSPFDGLIQDRVHKIIDSGVRVDSIIVCDRENRIFSNPNNFLLGLTHDDPAADTVVRRGLRHTDTTRTAYGDMLRVYVPVFESGRQVGYVEVGAMLAKLDGEKRQLYSAAGIFLLVGLGLGCIGAVYQARRIKSVLLGLEPEEIVQLYHEHVGIRQLVGALRANSHEFSNKLQAILGMLEMEDYDAAKEFIAGTQARHGHLDSQLMRSLQSPMLAGLILGKLSVASEQRVSFSVEPDSSLREIDDPAVAHELVTIIGNLVDNALDSVRNIQADRAVTLRVRDEDNSIVVSVRDNGPGMDAKTRESIFIRGFSTKGEGRGTGLYLVRRAVRLLNGEIRVESVPGQTTFTVIIPRVIGEKP